LPSWIRIWILSRDTIESGYGSGSTILVQRNGMSYLKEFLEDIFTPLLRKHNHSHLFKYPEETVENCNTVIIILTRSVPI
jgi:hypothetical protein